MNKIKVSNLKVVRMLLAVFSVGMFTKAADKIELSSDFFLADASADSRDISWCVLRDYL